MDWTAIILKNEKLLFLCIHVMTNVVKMHSENTDKIHVMSNQSSLSYPYKFH